MESNKVFCFSWLKMAPWRFDTIHTTCRLDRLDRAEVTLCIRGGTAVCGISLSSEQVFLGWWTWVCLLPWIMGSQVPGGNWRSKKNPAENTSKPLQRRVQWFLGYLKSQVDVHSKRDRYSFWWMFSRLLLLGASSMVGSFTVLKC